MIACYDLAQCPPTYDVVAFLARAEIERLRRNEASIDLRLLPGPKGGFREDFLWPLSIPTRESLLQNIVWPMCEMLPSMSSIQRIYEKENNVTLYGEFGARQYMISLPSIMECLGLGCRPLRAKEVEKDSKLITITLREADHHPRRNSNLGVWRMVAQKLAKYGYKVAIIRDTARVNDPLALITDGSEPYLPTLFETASTDLHVRAQLYASAAMNLGVNNGPMWFAIFLDAPVMMFKVTTNEIGGCYDDSFYRSYGLPPGSQLPTSPPYQRLVWENDDNHDSIVKHLCDYLELLSTVDAALGAC